VDRQLREASLPGGFERIFREHYSFVHRTAHRITGNAADAEDALQNLFIRLIRKELPAEVWTNPKAYLYRAAVNASLDVIRARRGEYTTDMTQLAEQPASTEPSRGEQVTFDRLRMALAELNPKAAEILILRHVHGYSDVDIANLLGTSRGTIAVTLFRSRRRLRKVIRAFMEGRP